MWNWKTTPYDKLAASGAAPVEGQHDARISAASGECLPSQLLDQPLCQRCVHFARLPPCFSRCMRIPPSQLRSCFRCQSGFSPSRFSWSSRATATFHDNRNSQKGPRRLVVLRLRTCLRIPAVRPPLVVPNDANLVLLRVSLREPKLVLFQHPNLRAGPARDVLLACQVGPVSSQ